MLTQWQEDYNITLLQLQKHYSDITLT